MLIENSARTEDLGGTHDNLCVPRESELETGLSDDVFVIDPLAAWSILLADVVFTTGLVAGTIAVIR